MKPIRCLVGVHATRHLWGVTPSPTRESVPKWIWQCPRCEGMKYSGSPKKAGVPYEV